VGVWECGSVYVWEFGLKGEPEKGSYISLHECESACVAVTESDRGAARVAVVRSWYAEFGIRNLVSGIWYSGSGIRNL
jgi:hypothetical protein